MSSGSSSAVSTEVEDELRLFVADRRTKEGSDAEPGGGATIGRYVVLYRHGRGGMGHVYAAYDPKLDRKIAIKLLRRTAGRGAKQNNAQTRLLREAQALAKLSHANVVAIHDVGLHEGRVFVAMEFIEGDTLRRWVSSHERSWREVVRVFMQAGSGLAAAHQAGLIHRDFKPENVIVRPDGKAQVLDFGLARTQLAPLSEDASVSRDGRASQSADESVSDLHRPITREGALVGTPAYMAPEQHEGRPADERSDQFAFCITLWEALFREHPFVADDKEDLRAAVIGGALREPARSREVPGWVRRILTRGLSLRPEERYASMQELLADLSVDRSKKRRRLAFGVSGIAALAVGAYLGGRAIGGGQHCRGAARELEGVWDPDTKAAIERAFVATGKPYAQTVWVSSERLLDDYTKRWLQMRVESCEATWLEETQSEEAFVLRSSCLQRRRDDLAALTDLLARADATVVERAVQAVHALPDIEQCADATALASAAPVPDDPGVRPDVEQLRAKLAQARAQEQAGKYSEGLTIAASVLHRAEQLGFRPLQAEALLMQGILEQRNGDAAKAEQTLREAVFAAEAGGHPAAAAQAWIELLEVARIQPSLHDQSTEFIRHAKALIERLGAGSMLEASLLHNVANLRNAQGRYEEAVEVQRQALALRERLLGERHPAVGASLRSLGTALEGAGRYEEALATHVRAQDVLEAFLGPDHPEIARVLNGRAIAHDDLGQVQLSRPLYARAVEIFEGALGPNHPEVAIAVNNLAGIHFADGAYEEALQGFTRALAIWESAYGPEHPDVALTLGNIGLALEGLGRYEDAAVHHARALELRERSLGDEHPDVAVSLRNLGDLYHYLRRYEDALPLHRRAVDILERALGPDHPRVATALVGLGHTHEALGDFEHALALHQRAVEIRGSSLQEDHYENAEVLSRRGIVLAKLGQTEAARQDLEQAIRIYDQHRMSYAGVGEARFALAKLLSREGDRPRAMALTERALEDYRQDAWPYPRQGASIKRWLARARGEELPEEGDEAEIPEPPETTETQTVVEETPEPVAEPEPEPEPMTKPEPVAKPGLSLSPRAP